MDPNNPLADREKSLENQWIKNKECVSSPNPFLCDMKLQHSWWNGRRTSHS